MLRTVFLLLWSLVLFSSCQSRLSSPKPATNLEAFEELILGTWVSKRKIKDYNERVEKTYFADGTAKGIIKSYAASDSIKLYLPDARFESRWKRKGDILLVYDIRWEGGQTNPSEIHYDQIVSISDRQFIFIDDPTKQRVVANKIK